MNKQELSERISERIGLTKKQAEDTLDAMVDIIIETLRSGQEVTITSFGTFIPRVRHARRGVNPRNPKEAIQMPEVIVAKFKTGKRLKDELKKKELATPATTPPTTTIPTVNI